MKDNKNISEDIDKDFKGGSTITDPEEKAQRKYDDWRSHKHEHNRNLDAEFRSTELHGVVGKEIEQVIEKDKPHMFKHQNLDYGNDIYNKDKPLDKDHPKDFNNKGLDMNPRENIVSNQEAEKYIDKVEHSGKDLGKKSNL